MFRSSHARVLVAASAFALALTAVVLSGLADRGALCDDAFYYFQISKNAAAGRGFSFDGVHSTNGFHPLMGWLGVPVFAVLRDYPWAPVRIMLLLLGLATAATAYVLYRIGKSAGHERAGELMAYFFILSPFTWVIPLRGCEGGLSILTIALALWQVARMHAGTLEPREVWKLGALVGLAGLARTENVFLAVGIGAWLLWRARRVRPLLAYGTAAAIVVSPWVIWNLVRFGSVMQVSGAAKVAFKLYHPLPPVRGVGDVLHNLADPFTHSMRFVAGEEYAKIVWSPTLVLVSAAILVAAILAGGRRRPLAVLFPIGVLVALHLGYYAFVQRSYFNWYFMTVVVGLAMLMGERLAHARRAVATGVVVAWALVCAFTLSRFLHRYPYEGHEAQREPARVLAVLPELPQGAQVGAWNVGAMGYFGSIQRPDITFFNLDCVVNNELFAAWKQGRYKAWVEEHVEWLIERPQGQMRREDVQKINGVLSRVVSDPTRQPQPLIGQCSSTRSICSENLPAGGAAPKKMPMRSWPSRPSNWDSAKV